MKNKLLKRSSWEVILNDERNIHLMGLLFIFALLALLLILYFIT